MSFRNYLILKGGEDAAAVGREHSVVDRAGVAREGCERLAIVAPQPRRAVI
jgi:hypothetical protein